MKDSATLLFGAEYQDHIMHWVAQRQAQPDIVWTQYSALGYVRSSRIIAGIVYSNFSWPNIVLTIAAEPGSLWATPGFLHALFHYPFIQLNCSRVTAVIARNNGPSNNFVHRLGFLREGVMRHSLPNGDDEFIYGLLREECRWLGESNV